MEASNMPVREERQAHPLSADHERAQRKHFGAGLVRVRTARQQSRERSLQISQERIRREVVAAPTQLIR